MQNAESTKIAQVIEGMDTLRKASWERFEVAYEVFRTRIHLIELNLTQFFTEKTGAQPHFRLIGLSLKFHSLAHSDPPTEEEFRQMLEQIASQGVDTEAIQERIDAELDSLADELQSFIANAQDP
jgi:hypothetical protein